MDITTKEVKKLAKLSMLEFSEKELENFKAEFEKTLQQIDLLNEVDTSNINLKPQYLDAEKDLRKDEIKAGLTNAEVLKNAADSMDGMIVVPVAIKKEI